MDYASKLDRLNEVFLLLDPYLRSDEGNIFSSTRFNVDLVSMLPFSVVKQIIGNLNIVEVSKMMAVSKRWNLFSSNNLIWRFLVERDFPYEYNEVLSHQNALNRVTWKKLYNTLHLETVKDRIRRSEQNQTYRLSIGPQMISQYYVPARAGSNGSDSMTMTNSVVSDNERNDPTRPISGTFMVPVSRFPTSYQNNMVSPVQNPGMQAQRYQMGKAPSFGPVMAPGGEPVNMMMKPGDRGEGGGYVVPANNPNLYQKDMMGRISPVVYVNGNPHTFSVNSSMNGRWYGGNQAKMPTQMQGVPQAAAVGPQMPANTNTQSQVPNQAMAGSYLQSLSRYGQRGTQEGTYNRQVMGGGYFIKGNPSENSDTETEDMLSVASHGSRKRRETLPTEAKIEFKKWLFRNSDHPYPSDDLKKRYAKQFDLSVNQVNNWFSNARRRLLNGSKREIVKMPKKRKMPFSTLLEAAEDELEKEERISVSKQPKK